MRHLTYPKIPTRLDGAAGGGPWIATEKVHGAQLVVGFDGDRLRVGKRKAWLADDEPFFGWQLLRAELAAAATEARAGGAAVRIYGELYGGHYPHPDIAAVPGAAPVQTGVWYAPGVRFALFDVLRHATPDDDGVLLTYSEVAAVAASAALDVVPLLARGTRTEVESVPVRFATRMAAGLPAIAGNDAEGVVLRPDVAVRPADRPVVKRKIAEFDEGRFDASRPWNPYQPLSVSELRGIVGAMVNPARWAGARSKVGPAGAVLDEVVLDVLVDLTEAYPAATGAIAPDALERLVREVVGTE